MNRRSRRMIEKRQAAREGRRMYAFYRGCKDRRAGKTINPFAAGSKEARCWAAGSAYAEADTRDRSSPPLCRFGPGGDFVGDWPEEEP